MEFKSINPYNGQLVGQHTAHTETEISEILQKAQNAFKSWREVPNTQRAKLMAKAGQILRESLPDVDSPRANAVGQLGAWLSLFGYCLAAYEFT